jgi:site-specific DNA recombinase
VLQESVCGTMTLLAKRQEGEMVVKAKSKLVPSNPLDGSRVGLYARVSTEEQKLNQTIRGQLEEIREWARSSGWSIVDEYLDDGGSGRISFENRPGAKRLLTDLSSGKFDFVIVWKYDRLGRTLKYILNAVDMIRSNGVGVKSKLDDVDLTTAAGVLQLQVQGAVAEYELKMIMERTAVGRLLKAKEGKWVYGPLPYGYDFDANKHPVVSQRLVTSLGKTEADVVREVFENIAQGSTAAAEALRLNQFGVPPIRRYSQERDVQHAACWQADRVAGMIHNTMYKGTYTIESESKGKQTIEVPALLDEVTWQRANNQLEKNRSLSKKNAKRFYLLRGLLVCAKCGHHYVGGQWAKGTRWKDSEPPLYYRCNQQSFHKKLGVEYCNAKVLQADDVEFKAWDFTVRVLHNAERFVQEAEERADKLLSSLGDVSSLVRALDARLNELEAEKERIKNLYVKGRLNDAEADKMFDDNTKALADVLAEKSKLRTLEDAAKSYKASANKSLTAMQRLRADIPLADKHPTEKRRIIADLVEAFQITTVGEGRHKKYSVHALLKVPGLACDAVDLDSRSTTLDYDIEFRLLLRG